jgi:Tfp pilus assembly protein PilO
MRELIERLQEFYDTLEGVRKWIFILLPFLVVSALAYSLYIEPAMQQLQEKEERIAQLSQKIFKHKSSRYEKLIAQSKKEILRLQSEIDKLESKTLALRTRLEKERFIFLNGENFAKLLEDMLQDSVKNNLELSQIKIEDRSIAKVGKLKVKKAMRVEGKGEFLNIVKFVRNIEGHPVLLSVQKFVVETNGSMPLFSVDIDFFGVEG